MRNSKILKIICYISIPILVLILAISLFYEICKEQYLNNTMNNNMYFQSDDFVFSYMQALSRETKNLIYNNSEYKEIKDGENSIFYNENEDNIILNIEDFYYMIKYRNKYYTNVELTSETNTVESIINYIKKINNDDGKYTEIIKGEVASNSQIITNKAIKYFNLFENTYYTTEKYLETESALIHDINEFDEGSTKIYNIYTERIDDLEIYSSYKEQISETEYSLIYKKIITFLNKYEQVFVISIPVVSIILVLIAIYLIISIGYSKDKEGIELNDLDKIPIEIVTGIVASIIGVILFASYNLSFIINPENMIGFISLYIALYFIGYILCAAWGITIVKRIKAKTIIKTSILCIILKWTYKLIVIVLKEIKEFFIKVYKKIDSKISLYFKIIGIIFSYIILSIALVLVFGVIGLIIDLILAFILLYPVAVELTCYNKIEKQIERIYNGDYSVKLNIEEFTPRYKSTVNYINDITSGFEKAIEEGVKSERLKTELITNVSHDIKTPLTSIINYVDLLKKENIENEKAQEYLDILDNKSQRLKKLIEDLVEASKASSGNVKLNLEKINICELIKQATGEFEEKFKARELDINMSYPENPVYINADNRYMYRVIENLFSNISKYALENSRVYIDIKKEEDNVNIVIKNISKDKLNISAEELEQRFVRGDKSRTTEGSGLGLSISKSLTELQRGKFNLQIDGDLFKVEIQFKTI